jgi:hypothetical protein
VTSDEAVVAAILGLTAEMRLLRQQLASQRDPTDADAVLLQTISASVKWRTFTATELLEHAPINDALRRELETRRALTAKQIGQKQRPARGRASATSRVCHRF